MILENIKTKQQYPTTVEILDANFIYGYCATCHSSQGASVDKSIAIHEWNKKHLVSREWLWTSLTRARDLNRVKLYVKTEDDNDDVAELTEDKLIRYLETKISNFKIQDTKANREIDENKYIDVQWFYDRVGSRCNRCSCEFEFDIQNGIVGEGGLFSNANFWLFSNARFWSLSNAAWFISQRAKAVPLDIWSACFWVSSFPDFLVSGFSWFLGFLVSGFLGFWVPAPLVSGFPGFLVSGFLGFWVSGLQCFWVFCFLWFFLVFWTFACLFVLGLLGFWVSGFAGFRFSGFLGFS